MSSDSSLAIPQKTTDSLARRRPLPRWVGWIPLVLLILLNLSIGLQVTPDYGVSWDEVDDAAYGADALSAYGNQDFDWSTYSRRKYYGPAHFMLQNMATPVLTQLMPEWGESEVRRFVNLLAFQVAILAMFILSRQFVGYLAALAGTLLFSLQPLLVGHAFINGKDTPFMAMFLLSVALGFAALRSLPYAIAEASSGLGAASQNLSCLLKKDMQAAPRTLKIALAVGLVLFVTVATELIIFNAVVHPQMLRIVTQAYDQTAPTFINILFNQVAEDRLVAPVDAYHDIASNLLAQARLPLIILAAVPLALIANRSLPRMRSALWQEYKRDWTSLKEAPLRESALHISLLVATWLSVGLATSIRVVGLLAVFLVGILYLAKLRSRALPPLVLFVIIAAVTCFITWPYIWSNPFGHLLESYRFLIGNPNKDYVLFMGEVVKGRLLPWYFLPLLMLVQFTEPLWLLVIAALILLMLRRFRLSPSPITLVVLLLWLLIPTVPLILQRAWFYDNFRQFLFVTPVFFLIAALALDFCFAHVRRPLLRIGLIALLLFPGITQIVRLHPYQYVYYSSLVGGSRGAVRQYELDYWATSYAKAMKFLNEVLPRDATVAFWGTRSAAVPHARSDLIIRRFNSEEDLRNISADVAVMITRANIDLGILRSTPALAEISVDNALLVIIKMVPTHLEQFDE